MHHALALASKAAGLVGPHALVGAVVVRDDEVVGKGYYRYYGDRHAEIQALEQAGEKTKGAELFVTLEPCCHVGKNPPCTDAIIHAGIKRVVYSAVDSNPKVSGGGHQRLEDAGIHVESGLLENESTYLNRAFLKFISTGTPWLLRLVNPLKSDNAILKETILTSDINQPLPVINLKTSVPKPPDRTTHGWPSIGLVDMDKEVIDNTEQATLVAAAIQHAQLSRIPFVIFRSARWIHTEEIIDEDKTQACRLQISKLVSIHTPRGKLQSAGFKCSEHNVSGIIAGHNLDNKDKESPLRIQSECASAHVLGDIQCDCGLQLEKGLALLKQDGIFLYLTGHEGRGLGIVKKFNEYAFRESLRSVPHSDARTFDCAASILLALKITAVRLMSRNEEKREALIRGGLKVR